MSKKTVFTIIFKPHENFTAARSPRRVLLILRFQICIRNYVLVSTSKPTSEIPLTMVAKCILCWQTSSLNVVSGRLLTSRGIWYSGTCFRSYSTVLCKSFRPPSFCLSHENSYLIQNGSNFKRTFTCVRAKRYLSLVTFKN